MPANNANNNVSSSVVRGLLLVPVAFFLTTGFLGNNPESEVANFIRDTERGMKANKSLDLGPLPQVEPYKPFTYEAKKANPFLLQNFVSDATVAKEKKLPEDQCSDDDCGDGAPLPHPKYILENYELVQLSMVGTLDKNRQRVALIKTPDAGVIEAQEGHYMGRNFGLIISIKPNYILVREKHQVARGWQNRMAVLELQFN